MCIRNKSLKEILIKDYKNLLTFIKLNSDLNEEDEKPPMTKDGMEKIYIKSTLKRVIDHGESIILLVKKEKGKTATLHGRFLLETYLQARLLKTINTEAAFSSFWHFAAYNEYKNFISLEVEKQVIEERFREIIKKKILEYRGDNVEEKYLASLEAFIEDYKRVFPNEPIIPRENANWWGGLSTKNIADLFPDGAKEMYLKLYWDMSSISHPNPRGHFEYIPISVAGRQWEESAMIYGIQLTIWISQLCTDSPEISKELQSRMQKLNTLLLNEKPFENGDKK